MAIFVVLLLILKDISLILQRHMPSPCGSSTYDPCHVLISKDQDPLDIVIKKGSEPIDVNVSKVEDTVNVYITDFPPYRDWKSSKIPSIPNIPKHIP